MCGRFTLTAEIGLLEERFAFKATDLQYAPSYNIAPSQPVLAVIDDDGGHRAGYLRWGLVPSWAKDPAIGNRMINARVETVADKPSFRQALRRRRCLVLADGFYEWRRTGKTKQPMYIRLSSHQPFAFAGLWDVWRDPAGTPLYTCTILTTTANSLLSPLHHRMPVMLDPTAEAIWVDRSVVASQELLAWLTPYASENLAAYAVSQLINSPHNNSPECIVPVTPAVSEGEFWF
jgi:putative SOS response-associated peptidase YedK